jgi:DNA (cytosine-5)-methyltransferase 1
MDLKLRAIDYSFKPHIKAGWPEKTHDKKGRNGLPIWKGVRPLLHLDDPGESIFDKDLVDNSLNRLYRGIKKFSGKEFLTTYYGTGANVSSIDSPMPTLTTKDRVYPVQCSFLMGEYGSVHNTSVDRPCPPLTANPKQRLVTSNFILNQYSSGGELNSVDEPCPSLTTVPKSRIVTTNFLMDHAYKNEGNSIDAPCPTLIARQDKKPKYVITANHFIMSTNFKGSSTSTIMACRKWNYLVTFGTIKKSSRTKKRKKAKYTLAMRRLKVLMGKLNITDIKMRSLHVEEMLTIMGFPADYVLKGTQTEQKKYIGNAVHAQLANRLISHHYYLNS